MKIVLKNLVIKNFKGIQLFSSKFTDKTVIAGRNEAGKTTVLDAFTWLFFDKNSSFNSQFELKPLDENGNVKHNLLTEVEAIVEIDDFTRKVFKKEFSEKWTKKRGTNEVSLQGHTTKYFIDEIPVKAGEYKKEIALIVDEENFKILSSAIYFNEKLHWTKRRELLTSFVDRISISSLSEQKKYSLIRDDIQKDGLENCQKKYNHQKKEIDLKLETIPARIDEVSLNISNIETPEKAIAEKKEIEKKIKELREEDKNIAEERSEILFSRHNKLSDLEINRNSLKIEIENISKGIVSRKEENTALNNSIADTYKKLEKSDDAEKEVNKTITSLTNQKAALRAEFTQIAKQIFNPDPDLTCCQTCKQELPPEMIKDNLSKAKENFEKGKKAHLDNITAKAKKINSDVEILKGSPEKEKEVLENLLKTNHEKIKTNNEKTVIEEKKMLELVGQLQSVNLDIEKEKEMLEEFKSADIKSNENDIETLTNNLDKLSKELVSFETSQNAKERLSELEKDLSYNNNLLLKIEQKIDLLKELKAEFIESIEGEINNLFDKGLSVRLFEDQLNGGFKETCEIMVRNRDNILVPYSNANTAGKINAGLQLVSVLSKKFNSTLPVWVDNAESVEKLHEISGQLISMKMIENQEKLKVN